MMPTRFKPPGSYFYPTSSSTSGNVITVSSDGTAGTGPPLPKIQDLMMMIHKLQNDMDILRSENNGLRAEVVNRVNINVHSIEELRQKVDALRTDLDPVLEILRKETEFEQDISRLEEIIDPYQMEKK